MCEIHTKLQPLFIWFLKTQKGSKRCVRVRAGKDGRLRINCSERVPAMWLSLSWVGPADSIEQLPITPFALGHIDAEGKQIAKRTVELHSVASDRWYFLADTLWKFQGKENASMPGAFRRPGSDLHRLPRIQVARLVANWLSPLSHPLYKGGERGKKNNPQDYHPNSSHAPTPGTLKLSCLYWKGCCKVTG